MYKKLIASFGLLLIVFISCLSNHASELITKQGQTVEGEACGMVPYLLSFDEGDYNTKEIIITDTNTSRIVSANTTKGDSFPLIFPSNIEDLTIIVNEDKNGTPTTESFNLNIGDCGYQPVVDNYVLNTSDRFSLVGNTVDMYLDNQTNIKKVKAMPLGGHLKKLKYLNDRYTLALDPNQSIYQLEIEYKDNSTRYYELDVNASAKTISSRIISGLEKKNINIKINFTWLWITFALIVLLIILKIMYKKAKRKEKKYLQYTKRRRSVK